MTLTFSIKSFRRVNKSSTFQYFIWMLHVQSTKKKTDGIYEREEKYSGFEPNPTLILCFTPSQDKIRSI